jgi:hypothetical protein
MSATTATTASQPGVKAAHPDSGVDVNLMDLDEEAFSSLMDMSSKQPPSKT